MQSILDFLFLGDGDHVNRGPATFRSADADDAFVFLEHRPSEDSAPEVGNDLGVHRVDGDDGKTTSHGLNRMRAFSYDVNAGMTSRANASICASPSPGHPQTR